MPSGAIPWLIAGLCVAVTLTLWFSVSYRELRGKRKALDFLAEEVRFHRRLHMQERGGEHDTRAENILASKLLVYRKLAREYNALLKRPLHRIPGLLLGFRPESEGHDSEL